MKNLIYHEGACRVSNTKDYLWVCQLKRGKCYTGCVMGWVYPNFFIVLMTKCFFDIARTFASSSRILFQARLLCLSICWYFITYYFYCYCVISFIFVCLFVLYIHSWVCQGLIVGKLCIFLTMLLLDDIYLNISVLLNSTH